MSRSQLFGLDWLVCCFKQHQEDVLASKLLLLSAIYNNNNNNDNNNNFQSNTSRSPVVLHSDINYAVDWTLRSNYPSDITSKVPQESGKRSITKCLMDNISIFLRRKNYPPQPQDCRQPYNYLPYSESSCGHCL